ncbi:MAG: phenylalanine--tRNA ligase subunit beta [Thermoplasmata archaeon]
MVVVSLNYRDLVSLLHRKVPLKELEGTIPMMGAGHEGVEDGVIRMDIFPNRPDMYSVEGVARALRGFLGIEAGLPQYDLRVGGVDLLADENVEEVRPYVVGGLVRGLRLTEELVVSIVELQERLHTGLGRRRKKVAIGLHDFDKVTTPLRYKAFRSDEVSFMPLGSSNEMTLGQILKEHEKGREYGWILEGKDLLPLILDDNDAVLSFPPIINGTVTALTPETTNVFVDVTGTDFQAVSSALNIIMTAMAERGGQLNSVTIICPDRAIETPDLNPSVRELSVTRANELLGLNLSAKEAVSCLRKMRLGAKAQGGTIQVEIPAYRTDILHEVDLIEDVAIGYGFQKFEPELPQEMTVGQPSGLNEFTKAFRQVLIGHGLQEVRTLTFQDADVDYRAKQRPLGLINPITSDLNIVRSSLLPSVLEILRLNRRRELPQRIFEIDDVVLEGHNRRHVGGAIVHPKAGFTEVKGLAQGILRDLGLTAEVEEEEDENFLEGRCARPTVDGRSVGLFGELKPEVIVAYDLVNPVVAFELDVEEIFGILKDMRVGGRA